eukprot:6969922-Alexandrium_andersonii.AAC.1
MHCKARRCFYFPSAQGPAQTSRGATAQRPCMVEDPTLQAGASERLELVAAALPDAVLGLVVKALHEAVLGLVYDDLRRE